MRETKKRYNGEFITLKKYKFEFKHFFMTCVFFVLNLKSTIENQRLNYLNYLVKFEIFATAAYQIVESVFFPTERFQIL